MATPTRRKSAGTRVGATTTPPARAAGPSPREAELEKVLTAVVLANGGDLVVSYEHAGAATMRPDIHGVGYRYTPRGLEIQVITEDQEEDDLASGYADDDEIGHQHTNATVAEDGQSGSWTTGQTAVSWNTPSEPANV